MPDVLTAQLGQHLAALQAQNLYRTRKIIEGHEGVTVQVQGQTCLNFCSNDYLGLKHDPRVVAAAQQAISAGTGASALVSGYQRIHAELEEAFAAATGKARALLFSSGYAANLGAIPALMNKEEVVVSDTLNHASLIDGLRLSGATVLKSRHLDLAHQHSLLAEYPPEGGRHRWLVSDSLFSMDGDSADPLALQALAETYLDDAHGFGLSPTLGLPCTVQMVGFGKSLGTAGAVVLGSEAVIEYLIQRARTYIFSTAPPPALAAATLQSLHLIQNEAQHRERLAANIQQFKRGAAQLGLPLLPSDSPIQPLLMGREDQALAASQTLWRHGIWVAAIRPPTVPVGTCRLRMTLTAAHQPQHIDQLLAALAQL